MWTGYETGNAPPSNKRYWDGYLITNGARQVHKDKYGPEVVNAFLVDFIKRNKDRPFMVYYPMMEPHGPQVPTPENKDSPPKGKDKLYAGMVTHVDNMVGRIADTIDRLELREKTLIIFTCDNGSSVSGTMNGKAYPKGKGRVVNWGAHVPFVVRAPFLTGEKVGRTSEDLIDFSDVFPTLVELAGGKMPADVQFDGRSIAGLIDQSAAEADKRTWIFSQRGDGRMIRDKQYLLDNTGDFYDLKDDPLQKKNLAKSENPAHAAARARLSKVLNGMPENSGPPFAKYGKREKK